MPKRMPVTEREILAIDAIDYISSYPIERGMMYPEVRELLLSFGAFDEPNLVTFPIHEWDWDPEDPATGMVA
jgi:hypothetical protein